MVPGRHVEVGWELKGGEQVEAWIWTLRSYSIIDGTADKAMM